jgi:hypothetical protein
VERDREDVGAVVEDRLGPVAVVHVPVEHRDAPGLAGGERGLDRDGDVGQQAEAVREVGQAVVARAGATGRRRLASCRRGRQERGRREARRQRGDLVAAAPEGRAQAELAAAGVGKALEFGR